jgi:hypothetical protein
MIPTVKVVANPKKPGHAAVYINGIFVPGLIAVETKQEIKSAPEVTLKIRCLLELASEEETDAL